MSGGKIPAVRETAFKVRWRQARKPTEGNPSPWWDAVTGDRVYDSLDDVLALCEKVNARSRGEMEQWPVEIDLSTGEVLSEYRGLVGLSEAHSGAQRVLATPPSGR